MLASVVIDNHKYAEFVAAAIESVLQQSYPQIQVVVVDDGSTDHSRSGIDRYADRITRVDKAQGGQASAINAGVAHSRGEVVFIFDADDVLYPDIVERVMRAFADEQDVAWVQFRLEVIDAVGLTAGALKPPECLPRRTGDLRRAITAFPFDIVRMATSGNAFARAALQQMLPIPEHIYRPSGDDWYLCPLGRAVRAGRVPCPSSAAGTGSTAPTRPGSSVDRTSCS